MQSHGVRWRVGGAVAALALVFPAMSSGQCNFHELLVPDGLKKGQSVEVRLFVVKQPARYDDEPLEELQKFFAGHVQVELKTLQRFGEIRLEAENAQAKADLTLEGVFTRLDEGSRAARMFAANSPDAAARLEIAGVFKRAGTGDEVLRFECGGEALGGLIGAGGLFAQGGKSLIHSNARSMARGIATAVTASDKVRSRGVRGEEILQGYAFVNYAAALAPMGNRLATASSNGVRVWDAGTREMGVEIGDPKMRGAAAIAWDSTGSKLLAGHGDKALRVWDVKDNRMEIELKGHPSTPSTVAWSRAGRYAASAGRDAVIRIWDLEAKKLETTLSGHKNPVTALAWSPDSNLVASASEDKTVRLWDLRTKKVEKELKGHEGKLAAAAWSPDGSRIATCGDDKTVRIWKAGNGALEFTLKGHEKRVASIAWSPSGKRLYSGSQDGTLRVWDVESGKEVGVVFRHWNDIGSLSLSPDGGKVAMGGAMATLRTIPEEFR